MKAVIDNTFATLIPKTSSDVKILDTFKNKTKVMAPGAIYMKSYHNWKKTKGRYGWDGKVQLVNGNRILSGLAHFVAKELPGIEFEDVRHIHSSYLNPLPDWLYDFQKSSIRSAFEHDLCGSWWPRGVIQIATGGGKTRCAAAMTQMANVPTAFIVDQTHLVNQAVEEFESLGIECGVVGSGKFNPKKVTVCTIQTLYSFITRGDWDKLEWCKEVKQLFIDEAHGVAANLKKGNAFVSVVTKLFGNAYMRWGLTATPFMRDNYSNWLLEGVCGPKVCEVNSQYLISKGYLTPPDIQIRRMPKERLIPKSWPECYDIGIVLNENRNKLVVKEILNASYPALILVDQIGHGDIIQRIARMQGYEIPFLHGQNTGAKERMECVKKMEAGKLNYAIASTIFDKGLNIRNLRTIILAGAKKSPINMIQRIGRGLRLAKNKRVVTIIDFYDDSVRKLEEHSKLRIKTWKDQGYQVILK